MSHFKRIFIALKITTSTPLNKSIEVVKGMLKKSDVKWEVQENYHITLHFIGNAEPESIAVVKNIINSVCVSHKAFAAEIKNIGFFYRHDKPAIIWAGVEPSDELHALYSELQKKLLSEKIEIPLRPFKPHLTIGRFRKHANSDAISPIEQNFKNILLQQEIIKEVFLYESILSPQGAVFLPLHVVKL